MRLFSNKIFLVGTRLQPTTVKFWVWKWSDHWCWGLAAIIIVTGGFMAKSEVVDLR